jgi:drug/metabolite transporter (DMT)-like permease
MDQRRNSLRAAAWMTGSVLSFTAMAVAGRKLAGLHDSFEILMWRSAFGFVLVMIYATATGQTGGISSRNLGGHLLRNTIHFIGQNLWFWALTLIPLAQVFALEFTSPLWVIVLSPLLLGERLTRARVLAVLLGFVGILIVTHMLPRPAGFTFGAGTLAAALSAVFFALTSILTKRLSRSVSVTGILFWLTLMQFGLGLACALADGQMRWPTAATLPWLALVGLCGVVAHLSLTSALRLAPASFVTPLDFLRLPLIAIVAALVFSEPLDPHVLIGGAVVLAGIWLNLRAELRPQSHSPTLTNP